MGEAAKQLAGTKCQNRGPPHSQMPYMLVAIRQMPPQPRLLQRSKNKRIGRFRAVRRTRECDKKCPRDFFPPQNWTLQAWVGPARDCTEIIAALQSAIVPNFQARNHRNMEATSASLLLVNYGPNSGQRIWRNSRDKKDVGLTAVPKKNEPKGELTIVTFSLFR